MDSTNVEVRSLSYTEDGSGIDCEINHTELGWIPFTARAEDPEEYGRAIYAMAVSGELGDISAYVSPFTDAELLAAAVQSKKNQIGMWRDEALKAGFAHTDGYTYQADSVSYANITGVITAISQGVPLPDGFQWRTDDDICVDMDSQALIALGTAMLAFINECYQRSWTLKTSADACQSVEDVDAITW